MLKIDKAKFELNNAVTIKAVAWMSFLWSLSSLMVFSVLPAFLVDELKMGHSRIGIFEGLAVSVSFLAKFFSGYLSDVFKERKPLIMMGTVLNAVTKPLFALCTSAGMMFGLKFSDRLIKGIRSAPTDALVADLSQAREYASNFGLRQALYTLGAVAGALIAMILMLVTNNNYRLIFALSGIPAVLAVLVLWFWVRPNPKTHPRMSGNLVFKSIRLADLKKLPPAFWWLMVSFFFLMLGRFSETFLALKAKEVGFSAAYLPALVIFYDLIHAGIAWPSGKYADLISRKQMLAIGLMIMIAAQCLLASMSSIYGVLMGVALVGLHMGVTQGLLKALIAQYTPPEIRGTAFSLFFIISGFALFLANAIAGKLAQSFGFYATFLAGGAFTAASMGILYAVFLRAQAKMRPAHL
jgi:MFS family permease